MATRELKPADLGINGVDMKALVATKYASGVLEVVKDFAWTLVIDITETGSPAAGVAKLTIDRYLKNRTTIIDSLDLLTAIDTINQGQIRVAWGFGATALKTGSATLDSDSAILQMVAFMKVTLEVVTANDGTTCTADVTLFAEHVG